MVSTITPLFFGQKTRRCFSFTKKAPPLIIYIRDGAATNFLLIILHITLFETSKKTNLSTDPALFGELQHAPTGLLAAFLFP